MARKTTRKATRKSTNKSGKNLWDGFTEKIIKDTKKSGKLPWQRPWFGSCITGSVNTPNKPYNFMNKLLVSHPGKYMTWKYMQKHKIQIVKTDEWEQYTDKDFNSLTEYGRFMVLQDIVYGNFKKKEMILDDEGNPTFDDDGNLRQKVTKHRCYYPVIWEGFTTANTFKDTVAEPKTRIDSCEALLKYYTGRENIRFVEVFDDRAYFQPSTDTIHLPKAGQFKKIEQYYATAFHEATHSTGVKKRLDRDLSGSFGSKSYAREELVAELGSAFLCAQFGIRIDDVEKNNVAYIQSWLTALENDHELMVKAAAWAEKAVNFILDGFIEVEDMKKAGAKARRKRRS